MPRQSQCHNCGGQGKSFQTKQEREVCGAVGVRFLTLCLTCFAKTAADTGVENLLGELLLKDNC